PARGRIFGFDHADVAAHLAVRPDGVKFQSVHAKVGTGSDLSGGFVSLGFQNDLRIEVERADVLVDDVSPIGPVKMSGRLLAKATVGGKFNTPTPEGEILRGESFKVADVTFGDLSGGKFKVDVHKPEIELTGIRAKKGQSDYEVSTARLDFGGGKGFKVDALA